MDFSSPARSDIDTRRAEMLSMPESLRPNNKHCLLMIAKQRHLIVAETLENILGEIRLQSDFCDWGLCIAVRLLYFDYGDDSSEVTPQLEEIENALNYFPFWPILSLSDCANTFCFWSENHSFMFLSSAHLFYQRVGKLGNRETFTLKVALRAKIGKYSGRGLYEVLSHVYLPYTFCAMLNLIDFSLDPDIVNMATEVADMIVHQLALGTTDQGVCSLTASARHFNRCRVRTFNHNVNQLMLIVAGIPVEYKVDSVTGFLLTSKYRPSIDFEDLIGYKHEYNVSKKPMNHPLSKIDDAFISLSADEKVPFYWSAGLVTHPDFIERTKDIQVRYRLQDQVYLNVLTKLPEDFSQFFMSQFGHWSKGQNYTGIVLNLYKAPGGLMLSSFEMYNVGLCGFQQMPWVANIGGLGVWSGSGTKAKLHLFDIQNLYNPYVSQRRKLLVSAYVAPKALLTLAARSLLNRNSYVHWPSPLFDEELRQHRIGGRLVWVPHGEHRATEPVAPDGAPIFPGDAAPQDGARAAPVDTARESIESVEDPRALEAVPTVEEMERIVAEPLADILDDCGSSSESESEGSAAESEHEASAVATGGLEVAAAASKTKTKKKKDKRLFGALVGAVNSLTGHKPPKKRKAGDDARGTQAKAWWVARRGDALIGLCCTSPTMEKTINSVKTAVQLHKGADPVHCPWRVSEYRKHAWIVRVGTLASPRTVGKVDRVYSSLQSFADYCANGIEVNMMQAGNSMMFEVHDTEEGDISFAVDLQK